MNVAPRNIKTENQQNTVIGMVDLIKNSLPDLVIGWGKMVFFIDLSFMSLDTLTTLS